MMAANSPGKALQSAGIGQEKQVNVDPGLLEEMELVFSKDESVVIAAFQVRACGPTQYLLRVLGHAMQEDLKARVTELRPCAIYCRPGAQAEAGI